MQWCILALFFGEEHVDPFWERVKCVVHKELLKSHRSGVHLLSVLSGYVQVTSDSHGYLLCGGSGARWDEKKQYRGSLSVFSIKLFIHFTSDHNPPRLGASSPHMVLPIISPPISSENGEVPLGITSSWPIKSLQDWVHPFPLRPDKAVQLGEWDPQAGNRVRDIVGGLA